MVSIRLVEALRFSRDRRVVLGILGFSRIFAEYDSAIPDCPKRIGRKPNSPASKVRGSASLDFCRAPDGPAMITDAEYGAFAHPTGLFYSTDSFLRAVRPRRAKRERISSPGIEWITE
uniref:Uncharacterized protein n=1 Tax=Candidatus Kentrum sp. FW TaxID=2126338 RepID=A0A450TTE4_9GAMM|nr:MAG: hypothetical protein BECKFW1821C_GA0114237_103011 [Candidatus Kentron sp. FW]